MLTRSLKNTSKYRCFHECQKHEFPPINSCLVPSKRHNYFLSADEIFFNLNEPVFQEYDLDSTLDIWGCVGKVTQEYSLILMFPDCRLLKLPRMKGCGLSNERQYCFQSADEIFFNFNEPFDFNSTLVIWGCVPRLRKITS